MLLLAWPLFLFPSLDSIFFSLSGVRYPWRRGANCVRMENICVWLSNPPPNPASLIHVWHFSISFTQNYTPRSRSSDVDKKKLKKTRAAINTPGRSCSYASVSSAGVPDASQRLTARYPPPGTTKIFFRLNDRVNTRVEDPVRAFTCCSSAWLGEARG